MDFAKLTAGTNPPDDINVIVEMPLHGDPVKYRVCRDSGALLVDRFLDSTASCPVNYGSIPGTLVGDGAFLEAMVIAPAGVVVGSVLRARPIGLLRAGDGMVLAVPHGTLHPFYDQVKNITDWPPAMLRRIAEFFQDPAGLADWDDVEEARAAIVAAIERT